jgi:hypothetical protein
MIVQAPSQKVTSEFAADVRAGLSKRGQRELPSKYLYDEVGSELFEAICLLPEYGLTRADARLLQRHAEEMVSRMPIPTHVAELGSGSGKKTRMILEALAKRQRKRIGPAGFYKPRGLREALSRGLARGSGTARAGRAPLRPVPGKHDWKFRPAGGGRLLAAGSSSARAGRFPVARNRPGEGRQLATCGLRRSGGRNRCLQSELAGAGES